MATNVIEVEESSFASSVTESSTPVLVDFWAPWCGPCKSIAPIIESLAEEMEGKVTFAKVDVDRNRQTATKFGISAIPTLLLFKNGEVVDKVAGLTNKDDLRDLLEKHL